MDHPANAAAGLLLDRLPEDLRQNIATRVCHGSPTRDALHLASASPAQRDAVLGVIRFRLSLVDLCDTDDDDDFGLSEWLHRFGPSLHRLSLARYPKENRRTLASFWGALLLTEVLALRTLRSIEILDYPDHLDAVTRWPPPKISIVAYGFAPPHRIVQALWDAPRSDFTLTYMLMGGKLLGDHFDPWAGVMRSRTLTDNLTRCSRLTSLEFHCSGMRECHARIWPTMKDLHPRTHVAVHGGDKVFHTVPNYAVQVLARMESVALSGKWVLPVAVRVGHAVKYLKIDGMHLSGDNLLRLSTCEGLKQLQVRIQIGVETVLPNVMKQLPHLEIMDIAWRLDDFGEMARVQPRKILEAVTACTHLAELSLMLVRVELAELKDVLGSLGARLRRFETQLTKQKEPPLVRIIGLQQTAVAYNPGLRHFLGGHAIMALSHERGHENVVPLSRQALCMTRKLQARATLLSTTVLESKLRAMIKP